MKGFVLLNIFFSFSLLAAEMSLVVRPMKEELTVVSPANIGAVLLEILNHTPYEEFEESIQLPENWVPVSQQPVLYLRPNDRNVKLLSFAVPAGTAAGNYQIQYHIYSRQFPEINDRYDFNVVVSPQRRLSIKIVQAKTFVLAGEEFAGTAALCNEGNQELRISLEITKGYFTGEKSFLLPPSSCRNIEVRLPTDKDLVHHQHETIILKAKSEDGKAAENAVFRFEIIPINGSQVDPYFRLPAAFSLNYLNFQSRTKRAGGFQGDVEIKGSFDEPGKHRLHLKMRGPDRFNLSPFGQRDEYSLNYQYQNSVIKLGDHFFQSSHLTEFSRYGRGLEVNYQVNRLSFGGFYLQPRFYKKIQEETALFVGYNLHNNFSLRLNFLEKRMQKSYSLFSVENSFKWKKKLELDTEYAFGKNENTFSDAWRAALSLSLKNLRWTSHFIYGDKDFPGYYTNSLYFSNYMSYQIYSGLRFIVNIRQDHQNAAQDSLYYSISPLSRSLYGGLQWNAAENLRLYGYQVVRSRKDRMPIPKFDYQERNLRVGINAVFKKTNFDLNFEGGKTQNRLQSMDRDWNSELLNRIEGAVYLNPSEKWNFKFFGLYEKSQKYSVTDQSQIIVGGDFFIKPTEDAYLNLHYQNNYSVEDYFYDRNLFELNFQQIFNRKHIFSIRSRYTLLRDELSRKEFAVSAGYTLQWGIPLKKSEKTASLHGRIEGDGESSVEGLILKLNGQTAVVKKDGSFSFPAVLPGTYYLNLDPRSLALGKVPTIHLPLKIDFKPGDRHYIEFGIVKSAVLRGSIKKNGSSAYENHEKLGHRFIVEIKKDNEILRTTTDSRGEFVFNHIRPGEWSVKIYRNGLPESLVIERDSFNVHVSSGQNIELSVNVVPKPKELVMFQESLIIMEQNQ